MGGGEKARDTDGRLTAQHMERIARVAFMIASSSKGSAFYLSWRDETTARETKRGMRSAERGRTAAVAVGANREDIKVT